MAVYTPLLLEKGIIIFPVATDKVMTSIIICERENYRYRLPCRSHMRVFLIVLRFLWHPICFNLCTFTVAQSVRRLGCDESLRWVRHTDRRRSLCHTRCSTRTKLDGRYAKQVCGTASCYRAFSYLSK